MHSQNARPRWWQLYLTFPLLITLFIFEHRLRLSVRGHQVAQIGILLLVYGLIYWWLKANAGALSRMDPRQHYRTVIIVQVPAVRLPAGYETKHSILPLPDTEIKGMLSTTFEMSYIDTEFLPGDEVSHELKKE